MSAFDLARAAVDKRAADDARAQRLANALLVPLALLLTALVLVFFVFFQTATVSGTSMLPTLWNGEHVLISRGLAQAKRGDIVVVSVVYQGRKEEWVKRIVAIGGDTVDVHGDVILVNGAPEAFQHAALTNGEQMPVERLVVAPGRVFLAGDDRGVSLDSRYVGTFDAASIRGKVVAVYEPIQRVRLVPGP